MVVLKDNELELILQGLYYKIYLDEKYINEHEFIDPIVENEFNNKLIELKEFTHKIEEIKEKK